MTVKHDHRCQRHGIAGCDCPCTCGASTLRESLRQTWHDWPQTGHGNYVDALLENKDMASIRRALGYIMATNDDTDPQASSRLLQAWDALSDAACKWAGGWSMSGDAL